MRLALLAALVLLVCAAPAADAAGLRAGVGRADVTPPTGYYGMGWVRSDFVLRGQHTRLFARAIVLERDGKKVALVAADLGAIAAGVVKHAADVVKDRGFSEANVLVSASHTHAAPTGYFNFSTYNTVFMTTGTPSEQNVAGELDPQLYAFMVRQIAEAIRRADDNLGPAAAGWGTTELTGITRNRSLEAHLHNHGIVKAFGTGRVADDPKGYEETISPRVSVLRVDRVRRGRKRVPLGIWSSFANHGTVNKRFFTVYNADHHGSATRVVEREIRRAGKVPATQDVVNAYGNADEGDMSAGLDASGPAEADRVGRAEAEAFLRAWRSAGRRLDRSPRLDLRWTRTCFCGQETEGGASSAQAITGLPLFTGSEEGRGPLHDVTQVPFEGRTGPDTGDGHGAKIRFAPGSPPQAVPLMVVRVGDHDIASLPGEMTAAMGERVRSSVRAAGGARDVVLSGLAGEYLSYFVTPEEYDMQHYEGGSTMFGRLSSNVVKVALTDLADRLAGGKPAPEPHPFDPTNGVSPAAEAFAPGADKGSVTSQPSDVARLEHAVVRWQGGPKGLDRPLGAPFVRVERRVRGRWVEATSDLGLQIMWTVGDDGVHEARWEVPHTAPAGEHRFVITANRYRLESGSFTVEPMRRLKVVRVAPNAVKLAYPAAKENEDIAFRPTVARGGRVVFLVDGRPRTVRRIKGTLFTVRAPTSARITIRAGDARDRWGNVNGDALAAAG